MRRFGTGLLTLIAATSLATAAIAAPRTNRNDAAEERAGTAAERHEGLGADIRAWVTAPARWRRRDWFELAGAVGAIGAAYSADYRIREHFGPVSPGVTPDRHDTADALPAFVVVAGTWIGARARHDPDRRVEAWSMLEAAAFGTATSYVVKAAAGRLRPYESASRSDWRRGGDSFPSAHTTAAFAIGTVLAESGDGRHRWLRRAAGYGVALGTAYLRLDHHAHWGSDTVAGAAIGIASARFVLRRHDSRESRGQVAVVPTDGGITLAYSVALD